MKSKFDYKWIIIGLCILMVMVSLGFVSSTKSLFPDEIAKALGVERSLVSIYESMRYISTAVVNLFFGFLIVKFKPKMLIIAGFVSLIASMLLFSYANSLWVLYVAGLLMGVGFSWTTITMVGNVVDIWCSENKGTIMGIILASNGIGGAIAIQVVGMFIDPAVTGSYRTAYRVIAAVLAVTALILLLFFRNAPKVKDKSAKELPKTKSKAKKRGSEWSGITFSATLRKSYFWGALICIFFSGFCLQGINGIVAMHFKDVGIDYAAVKSMLSFGSLLLAASKFLVGFVYDKFGIRVVSSFCMVVAIISSFVLALAGGGSLGMVFAVIYVILCQFALPLETIMLPLYATDLFGELSYANVLGIFVSVNVAGYAVGAPVMNLFYDIFETYVPAIIMVGLIMCAVFVLIQFVISAAHKERKRVEDKETASAIEAQG